MIEPPLTACLSNAGTTDLSLDFSGKLSKPDRSDTRSADDNSLYSNLTAEQIAVLERSLVPGTYILASESQGPLPVPDSSKDPSDDKPVAHVRADPNHNGPIHGNGPSISKTGNKSLRRPRIDVETRIHASLSGIGASFSISGSLSWLWGSK